MGLIKNKSANWIMSSLLVGVALILFLSFSPQEAESQSYFDMVGWGWLGSNCIPGKDCDNPADPNYAITPPIGWISFNCSQPDPEYNECEFSQYRVQIDITDLSGDSSVIGSAWIGNYDAANESDQAPIGWINMDAGAPDFASDMDYHHQVKVTLIGSDLYLTGWARIESIGQQEGGDSDDGWIRFYCANDDECPGAHYGAKINLEGTTITGSAWTGHHSEGGFGWIHFYNTGFIERPSLIVHKTDLGEPPYAGAIYADSFASLSCDGLDLLEDDEHVEYGFKQDGQADWLTLLPGDIGYNVDLLPQPGLDDTYFDWSTSGISENTYNLRCRICGSEGGLEECTEYSNIVSISLSRSCDSYDFCEDFTDTTNNDLAATTGNWDTDSWLAESQIDFDSAVWGPTPDNTATQYGSSVVYDGKIYLLAATFQVYVPSSGQWYTLTDKADVGGEDYQYPMLSAYQDKIYAFGGYIDGVGAIDKIQIYDIATDTWSFDDDDTLSLARFFGQAVTYDSKIYIIGGKNFTGSNAYYKKVDVYDTTMKDIIDDGTPDIKHARADFGLEVIQDKFYIIGGFCPDGETNCTPSYTYETSVEIYTPGEDWDARASQFAENLGTIKDSASWQGKIFIADGIGKSFKYIDALDLTVTSLTDRIIPRTAYAVDVVDNKLFIIADIEGTNKTESFSAFFSTDSDSYIQSGKINTTTLNIDRATLYAKYLDNGQTVNFEMSNNGGGNWYPVTPGDGGEIDFGGMAGSDLRWRAVLSSLPTDPDVTPRIYKVMLKYSYLLDKNVYGWGWLGADTQSDWGNTLGWMSLNCENNFYDPSSYTCHCATDDFCIPSDSSYVNYGMRAFIQQSGDSPLSGKMWLGDMDMAQEGPGGVCGGYCTLQYEDNDILCLRDIECANHVFGDLGACNRPVPDYSQCYATGYLQTDAFKSCVGGSNDGTICTDAGGECEDGGACKWDAPPGANRDTWDPYLITVEESGEPVTYQTYANIEEESGHFLVNGWGRFLSLRQEGVDQGQFDWGWVRFGSANVCVDSASSCIDDTGCPGDIVTATKCDISLGRCYVEAVESCTTNDGCNDHPGTTCASWCGTDNDKCTELHRIYTDHPILRGYAWSGGGTTVSGYNNQLGLGWIRWSPNLSATNYFQTLWGDIYLREGGVVETPVDHFSATYFIHYTDTIPTGFTTHELGIIAEIEDIDFPEGTEVYRNALGRLDYDEIINQGEEGMGRYGYVERTEGPAELSTNVFEGEINKILGHKIYYIDGNLSVEQAITILNGNNIGEDTAKAAGLIVVNGDLTINKNVIYESAAIAGGELRNIASLGWIVLGDVTVGDVVTRLDGAFLILGDQVTHPAGCWPFEEPPLGCGQFLSGSGSNSLEIHGLVMARYFNFGRTGSTVDPVEKVYYDGRIMVNTPPGLMSFTQGFPAWREMAP